MRFPSLLFTYSTLLALVGVSRAAGSLESDLAVAHVGSQTIRLSQLASQLEGLAPFQRSSLGATTPAQGRRFLEQTLTPDLVIAEHARKSGVSEQPRAKAKERALLVQSLIAEIERRVLRDEPVTDAEATAYYEQHPELFVKKESIRLQRLLVATEAEAVTLLAKAKQFETMDDWRNLVREKSLDKATSERGGELGFVAADGSTDVAELEVDPALFAAARDAKDGALLTKPVAEGKRFAVVFRRGSRPESKTAFTAEAHKIRQYLLELRVETKVLALVADLRREHLHEHQPKLLEGRDFSKIFDSGFPQPKTRTEAIAP